MWQDILSYQECACLTPVPERSCYLLQACYLRLEGENGASGLHFVPGAFSNFWYIVNS